MSFCDFLITVRVYFTIIFPWIYLSIPPPPHIESEPSTITVTDIRLKSGCPPGQQPVSHQLRDPRSVACSHRHIQNSWSIVDI